MRSAVEVVLASWGCAILALIVEFVLVGIGESGVVALQITHVLFLIAFVTSIIAAPLVVWLALRSIKSAVAAFIITSIVVGAGLWWLNVKLGHMRADQDAANKPPPVLTSLLSALPFPPAKLAKTPKSSLEKPSASTVIGNGNIAGNKIRGNNNTLTGQQNCPGGICAGGDINGSPTINNYGPPQRHLPGNFIAEASECLSKMPGTVVLGALTNDGEAWTYAEDWYRLFHEANWTIKDNMIKATMVGGRIPPGTRIGFRGRADQLSKQVVYEHISPEGNLLGCVMGKKVGTDYIEMDPVQTIPEGEVIVTIYAQPQTN